MSTFSGGCLCGAVRYTCSAEPMMSGHCHCDDCRRTSGTGHCSHMGIPDNGVTISGETKAYERASDSGAIVARHFCPTCGSALFSRNSGMPGLVFLRASSLDDLEVFKPQMHVYVARAASWDQPGADLPAFETMPPGMG
ncbi:MAG: GFA family protein [Hyphomonadaceae bacterium]